MADMVDSVRVTSTREALRVREYSSSPISGFAVGVALLGEDGMIYRRRNIECVGLTPSNCTERAAFSKAVSEGYLKFRVIAIVGGPKGKPLADYCPLCGVCHQLMVQFCSLDTFRIIMAVDETDWKERMLEELLPMALQRFNPSV